MTSSQTHKIKGNSSPNSIKSFELHYDRIPYNKLLGAHSHNTWELDYIKQGYGIHIFNGYPEPCREGEVILLPPNIVHNWIIEPLSANSNGRMEAYTLLFRPEIIETRMSVFPEMLPCINALKNITQAIEINDASARKIQLLLTDMAQEDELHQLPFFFGIIIEIAKCTNLRIIQTDSIKIYNPHVQNIIQKVYQYILNHYSEHITLDDIANIACMNKSSFCSFFKKHYTQNFFYVLNEHRINMACLLLNEEPVKSIESISFSVGFNDVPYFHRTFKKYKGCTPNQYRKKMRTYKKKQ
jgi:AraC-like DNA-binding protein